LCPDHEGGFLGVVKRGGGAEARERKGEGRLGDVNLSEEERAKWVSQIKCYIQEGDSMIKNIAAHARAIRDGKMDSFPRA